MNLTSSFVVDNNTIILIDGSSFVFRAFYAIPNLTSPSGNPTGAIYGVVSMLKQMQKKYPSKHFICVFDAPGRTFRDEIHAEYKATRRETPGDLIAQLADIHAIVAALGIPVVIKPGIEADDIIGGLAITAKTMGRKVVIATGDKDFAQLVDDDIILVNTMTNEVLDAAGVVNKFGVAPTQIIDYLSLVGDKVDNILGVDKCGPKTAVKWLSEYGNLDAVIAASGQIAGVVGNNLRKSIPWLATAKVLVTIKTDIPLDTLNLTHFDELLYNHADINVLREAYTRLGFKTWLGELDSKNVIPENKALLLDNSRAVTQNSRVVVIPDSIRDPDIGASRTVHECAIWEQLDSGLRRNDNDVHKNVHVQTPQELSAMVDRMIQLNQVITLLVIADNYQSPRDLRLCIFATQDTQYIINSRAWIPDQVRDDSCVVQDDNSMAHDDKRQPSFRRRPESISDKQQDLFTQPDVHPEAPSPNTEYITLLNKLFISQVPKILLNYKETLQILSKIDLTTWIPDRVRDDKESNLNNVVGDLTLAHYIKDSTAKHNLTAIYHDYLKLDVVDLPHATLKLTKDSLWLSQDMDAIIKNCTTIMNHAAALEAQIRHSMGSDELNLYTNIELPLTPILVAIENAGIMLNLAQFKQLDIELSERIKALENVIYQAAGMVFNLNSPKQLQDVLFNTLKLPTQGIKKNSNSYSTDEESLHLLEQHGVSIATSLLEYRTLSKLLNTYIRTLPQLVDKNHRVHTTFEQALVASGRLSSSAPNLQNIPVKSEFGRKIRHGFIAKPGTTLVCADYSQIELRILAHISEDENLIAAFNNDLDVHSATASEIFHKPLTQISKDERRYAKTINFSLLYGKTVFGLAQELNIDRYTAKQYIDAYFAKYPKVAACLESIKQFGREHGYVQTVFGRRIYLPNINASNKMLRERDERLALNAPMQGTSADIIKIAMCNLAKWLSMNKLKSQIILQVHDELILEVPDDEIEMVQANIANIMSEAAELKVKMAVDVVITPTWDHA